MAIRCRFVDSISATPTVRLDLNAGDPGFWLGKGGLHCPPPPLKRAETDTMLWDGGTISASAYGNRDLGLPLSFRPGTMDLRNALVSSLIKELNRDTNILEYRPEGSSTSYFFRTFRSPNFDPTMWLPKNPIGMINVDLYAEPFAYGLRVDQSATVTNNPAAGTNPMYVDVTINGDVAVPVFVSTTSALASKTTLMASRSRGTPSNGIWAVQAESALLSLSNNTTLAGSTDAAMSGAGNNYVRTAFGILAGLSTRLATTTFPAATLTTAQGQALAGTYRLYVRVRKSVAGDTVSLQATVGPVTGSLVTLPALTGPMLVDLGLFQIPSGSMPTSEGPSGPAIPSAPVALTLAAGANVGAGNLDWDYIYLVPADENLAVVSWPSGAGTLNRVWDGPNDMVYIESSGQLASGVVPTRAGSIPILSPGTPRLFFFGSVGSAGDAVTDTYSLTISHWPAYLAV